MFGNKNLETVNHKKKKLHLPKFVCLNSPVKHLGRTYVMALLGDVCLIIKT